MAVLFRPMTSLSSRLGMALGRIGGLVLVLLFLLPLPGRGAGTLPSSHPQGGLEPPPFLKPFPFLTVPLAESLTAQTPQVRQDAGTLPRWKRRWDEARQLAVAGELERAALLYQEVLAEMEISAARWELSTILAALGRDGEAIAAVESLSEESPQRPEYLHCLAVMELRLGRFRAAAASFIRLHALKPGEPPPLAGAVQAHLAAGDKEAALPLLLELWEMVPESAGLREGLATLAFEARVYAVAWPHLLEVTKGPRPLPQVLSMAAKTAEALGKPAEALGLWQRYAEARPDDLAARQLLAQAFSERGQVRQALPHLLAIRARRGDDLPVLKGIGLGYLELREFAKAVGPLEEYAALRPDDREVAGALVTVQEALGGKELILKALARYLNVEPHPDRETLEKSARLYAEAGDHAQAVQHLRRLQPLRPADPALLTELANELLALGREEEALTVWQELARLVPDDTASQRRLAALQERLGREQALYETLAIIHRLEPADQGLSLRLVRHYFARGDLAGASAVIATMEQQGSPLPSAFSYWRGLLHLRKQEFALALTDLEAFLQAEPKHEAARQQALVAAGRLGELSRVQAHAQALSAMGQDLDPEIKLLLGQAYADCRAEGEARAWYGLVVADPGLDGQGGGGERLLQAYGGLSESFSREGRPYEAEEALRLGLVITGDRRFFLPRLFSLALAQGRVEEAGAWLAALRPLEEAPWRLNLLAATLLVAQGEERQARRVLRLADEALAGGGNPEVVGAKGQNVIADRLALAARWLKAGRPSQAASEARLVLAVDPDNLEAKVIVERAGDPLARAAARLDLSALRHDQLCALAALYLRHELPEGAVRAGREAQALAPHSLPAGLALAEGLVAQGEIAQAIHQLERLAATYPQEFSLQVRVVTLRFRRGETPPLTGVADAPAAASWPELALLRARTLWRQNRWEEAIAVYQEFLTPKVAAELRRESEESGTPLPEVIRQRSIWEVVTRDPGPDPEALLAEQVLAPQAVITSLDQGKGRLALAAARLVARHRWQTRFAMELAPRQSVVRREYTIARQQYEALLDRYPGEGILLYDLAGIYSRLGTLGLEAAAYDRLKAQGVGFPELEQAVDRNLLKQEPRAALNLGYQSEAGREGYLDRDKEWQGVSYWDSLSTQHEAEATVERIHYHAGSREDVVRSTRAMASYSAGLLSGLTVRGGAGVHSQDQGEANTLLVNAEVVGKVGDGLVGTMAMDRDVVDDTTASLRRQVVRQDLRGGLSLTPLPRLAVGGGYLARDYSDNNWTTGYELWSTYLLLAEPTFLRFKYSYDFKESREGASPGEPGEDGFGPEDHPYWAPKNYWVNQVGLFFKHSLAEDSFDRTAPQYYSVEYAVGHDVDGYAVQTAKAILHAEFSPRWLMEAATEVITSQAVRKEEYRLSAIWRW